MFKSFNLLYLRRRHTRMCCLHHIHIPHRQHFFFIISNIILFRNNENVNIFKQPLTFQNLNLKKKPQRLLLRNIVTILPNPKSNLT